MYRISTLIIIAAVCFTACRAGDSANSVLPSDNGILTLAYHPSRRVPDGFFVDERADTEGSYTMYHITDESTSYELCSDDFEAAAALDVADNATRAVNGDLAGSFENDRYFEFVRELTFPDDVGNTTDPTPGFSRVFKCSYVNRSGVDRMIRDGYAGTLNIRPLDQDAVRTLAEYLWQFTYFWPAKKTVLESYTKEFNDRIAHTLLLAFVTNQGFDNCDLVEVVEWVFTADKGNGEVIKDFQRLYSFEARLVAGVPEKCNG